MRRGRRRCRKLSCSRCSDHQSFNAKEMKEKFKHLKNMKLPNYENVQPTILIGLRHARLMAVSHNRLGKKPSDPIASKTPLGWVVWGTTNGEHITDFAATHYHQAKMYHHQLISEEPAEFRSVNRPKKSPFFLPPSEDDELTSQDRINDDMIREYFANEDFGFMPRNQLLCSDDKRALEIMSSSIRREDSGHYSMLLPWIDDNVVLPDNFDAAVKRMKLFTF